MSAIWVGIACVAALIALGGEWAMGVRERRVREVLEQPLDKVGTEKKRLYQMLFVTSLLALFLALALAGAHRQFLSSLQGVAVVFDTTAFLSERDPSQQLSVEKGAITELIRSLPGVTLSLYELRGGAVHLVVPPTIDRLFFELQLDGILSSPSTVSDLTISAIQSDVVGRFSGIPPWVVMVSPMTVKSGKEGLDGVACMNVDVEEVLCTVYEAGLSFKRLTIEKAALMIIERLNRSTMPTAPDSTESFLLIVCTGLAWICFVMWRKANVPLFVVGMFLAVCPQAFSLSDDEANGMIRDAANLAEAKDFEASQKAIESLLTMVADSQGRQRLLYDRAFLSYLQGKDADALLWLNMESAISSENVMAEVESLRGLALTRLVLASTDENERLQRKKILREWLEGTPKVSKEVIARATIALFSPSVQVTDIEAVRRTLHWLEENAQSVVDEESALLMSAAALLTQEMNSSVERQLSETWPKSLVRLFSRDMAYKQKSISTLRIWYDFAGAATPNEGVSFLLNQASMCAHTAVFFPRHSSAAKKDLALVLSVLSNAIPALSEQNQRFLQWLLAAPTGDGEQRAASWYARAVLWPAMQNYSIQQVKSVALLLCHEVDAPSSILAQKTLATLIASACSFPGSSVSEKSPLHVLLQKVLSVWYVQDAGDALDTVLQFTDKDPQRWAPRLFAIILPYIQKAQGGGTSLPSVMARGVGDDAAALDPVLTGRLWQVAVSSVDTPQDVSRDVDHLILLFSELFPRLSPPTDQALRSLVLIFSIQPFVFRQLSDAEIFQKNPTKRAIYDQLLQEWNTTCVEVQQRIGEPATFRLPKVKQEVESCIEILRRLQALLRESDTLPAVSESREKGSSEQSNNFSIRGEDAIRLFQEMDRSDRELYGE